MYKDKRFSFFIMIEKAVPVPSTLKCIEFLVKMMVF